MLVFSTPLVNQRPSNLLTSSSTPPPPLHCANKHRGTCVYTVCNGGGSGTSDKLTPAAKYLYWSVFKKSLHLGFGVFIDICPWPWLIFLLFSFFIMIMQFFYLRKKTRSENSKTELHMVLVIMGAELLDNTSDQGHTSRISSTLLRTINICPRSEDGDIKSSLLIKIPGDFLLTFRPLSPAGRRELVARKGCCHGRAGPQLPCPTCTWSGPEVKLIRAIILYYANN